MPPGSGSARERAGTPSAGERAGPLSARERALGRRLAIASHPASMTHRTVFTEAVPTLVLVSLGASEAVVGLQRAFEPVGQLLQLPTLRFVGRVSKRHILVGGHCLAVVAGVPLLFFGALAARGPDVAVPVVLASLAVTAVGIATSQTVWFPLLRAYTEPDRVGRFFGALRTSWHVALIAYFLGAQAWLTRHPGAFAPLFAVGLLLGAVRIALILRLPERSERTGEVIRVRAALALLARDRRLRRYLAGVAASQSVRAAVLPFAIVMMRRALGLGEGEVLLATVATYAGGLASLAASGRLVDRYGPVPVFRVATFGASGLLAALLLVGQAGAWTVVAMAAFFFAYAALREAFGIADTHVLFELAPEDAPARVLVVATVAVSLCRAAAPLLAGFALDAALAAGVEPLGAYRALFAGAALVLPLAYWPLRTFRERGGAPGG